MKMIRQGDVLLIRTNDSAEGLVEASVDPRGVVLAEGETSGHYHRLFGRGHKLFRRAAAGERMLVVGADGGELRVVGGGSSPAVDRHTPVSVEPGRYILRLQRAWTIANASRAVRD